MSSGPTFEGALGSNANAIVDALARAEAPRPVAEVQAAVGRVGRSISVYGPQTGYDLQEELDFLTNRAIEPNIFFSGRFLAPAMPRLEDRLIRLIMLRDDDHRRSRLRFVMPFSVEKPGFSIGPTIMRSWANPFGPLGTPLLDREDAGETLDNLFEALSGTTLGLPHVMVLPDIRTDGAFSQMIRAVALARGLPMDETPAVGRPALQSLDDGETYLKAAITKNHYRELKRQWRKLSEQGELTYSVARQPAEVRPRLEDFLMLEASGWKGQRRTAMIVDRYRAAFAREAINNLAEADGVRIHTLDLDGRAIASMIVLVASGEAYTWKTAYDESLAAFSPGKLLLMRLTEWQLEDANILRTDSCGDHDHPLMSRLWRERMPIATLIIGLQPNRDRDVRQVSTQLHLYRNTRNMAKMMRDKIRARLRGWSA